jgi:hypothetical protein
MTEQSTMQRVGEIRPAAYGATEEVLDENARLAMLTRILAAPESIAHEVGRRSSPVRRKTLVASTAAATVAVGLAAGAIAVSHNGSGSASSRIAAGAAIKVRLVSALDTSNDVIETKTTWSDGSSLVDWSNASGTIDHVIQTGWPETLTTVTSSGTTFVAVYSATKTWLTRTTPGTEPIGGTIAIDDLRSRVQTGTLTVLATGVSLDGENTTELVLTDPPLPPSADSDLWVDSSTDLPVQEASPGSSDGEMTWTYYPPNSSAASNLTMPVPADYTEVPVPAADVVPPGGTLPIRIWNGANYVSGGATCPPAGSSCFTYPPTLPLPLSSTPVGSSGTASTTPTSAPSSVPPSSNSGTAPSSNSGTAPSSDD